MKYRMKFLLIVMFGIIFSGCSNDVSHLTTNAPEEKAQQEEVQNDGLSSEAEAEFLTGKLKQFYTAYPAGKYLVKPEDVRDVLGSFFIIDIRDQAQYEIGHLPNAVNIPRKEIPNQLSDIPKNENILVICDTGVSGSKFLRI